MTRSPPWRLAQWLKRRKGVVPPHRATIKQLQRIDPDRARERIWQAKGQTRQALARRTPRGLQAWIRFAGAPGRLQSRLTVIDYASVRGRRRLVLVRRDDVEHLVLIGGATDVVVESNIAAAALQRAESAPDPYSGDPRRRVVRRWRSAARSPWPVASGETGSIPELTN